MVHLYTSPCHIGNLPILITSLSVGIPNIPCSFVAKLPKSILASSDNAFHVKLPLLSIDKKNSVSSSVNAILLYLSSLQEKLQLVTGVSTIEYLDMVEQCEDDQTFLRELRERSVESDSYLEKMDHWTLADVAVYARLRQIQQNNAQLLKEEPVLPHYMQFVASDKFFTEGEARYARLTEEAVMQTVRDLNTGDFWTSGEKEDHISALERLLHYYKAQVPLVKDQDREKRSQRAKKATEEQATVAGEEEISRSAMSDVEAYEKAIVVYEKSLKALKGQ